MISLDTNLLVRILVADDPAQTRRAAGVLDRLDSTAERAHVSEIVLCEVVWVLGSAYGHPRERIATALRSLAAARQLTFDSPDRVIRAISAFERGKGDFADYLIREHARAAGCESVLTFDKVLLREDGFAAP